MRKCDTKISDINSVCNRNYLLTTDKFAIFQFDPIK